MVDDFEWAAIKARQAKRDAVDPAIAELAESITFLAEGLKKQAEIQRWIVAKLSQ